MNENKTMQESTVNGNLNESETLEYPPSALSGRGNNGFVVGNSNSKEKHLRSESSSTTSSGLPSPKIMPSLNPVNAYKATRVRRHKAYIVRVVGMVWAHGIASA